MRLQELKAGVSVIIQLDDKFLISLILNSETPPRDKSQGSKLKSTKADYE
jgi:hypothetical protein